MANKDFTAKNLHEYVDSYLKSYYEVEDKDASADANMQTQDVKTGDTDEIDEPEIPQGYKNLLKALIKCDVPRKKIIQILVSFGESNDDRVSAEAVEKLYNNYKEE